MSSELQFKLFYQEVLSLSYREICHLLESHEHILSQTSDCCATFTMSDSMLFTYRFDQPILVSWKKKLPIPASSLYRFSWLQQWLSVTTSSPGTHPQCHVTSSLPPPVTQIRGPPGGTPGLRTGEFPSSHSWLNQVCPLFLMITPHLLSQFKSLRSFLSLWVFWVKSKFVWHWRSALFLLAFPWASVSTGLSLGLGQAHVLQTSPR